MYGLTKKNWKGIYEQICWDRALVLWKKNLPGRGLTKVEKHCPMASQRSPKCALPPHASGRKLVASKTNCDS